MDKKRDIIQAAERLFYSNGFHATSTDRICAEAGVSTRTLYRYFPSREALTEAVMEARQTRFFGALPAAGQPESIARLFTELGKWMREYGASGCFFLKAWGEYTGEDASLSAQALSFRHALRNYIAASLHDQTLVNAVWMLFEGAITSAIIIGPAAADDASRAMEMLLQRRETAV